MRNARYTDWHIVDEDLTAISVAGGSYSTHGTDGLFNREFAATAVATGLIASRW